MAKRFIGLLVVLAFATLLIRVSYAANKITLACSGTETSGFKESPVPHKTFIIDMGRGTVTATLTFEEGQFPITEVRESYVAFRSGDMSTGQTEVRGSIDRISGHVLVSVYHGLSPADTYDLTCKHTKPLF